MDLHRAYKNLVAAIFRGIEECAASMVHDAKTPDSMIRLGKKNSSSKKNFLFFFYLLHRKLSSDAT